MHILFASDVSIKELLGGAERGLHARSVGLAARGHQVAIITRKLDSHTLNDEIIDGVHEYRYAVDRGNPLNFLLTTIRESQSLYKKLNRQFDVIDFHQPFTALGLNLLADTANTKKIYTCHSLSFEEYVSRNKGHGSLGNVRFVRPSNVLASTKSNEF